MICSRFICLILLLIQRTPAVHKISAIRAIPVAARPRPFLVPFAADTAFAFHVLTFLLSLFQLAVAALWLHPDRVKPQLAQRT